MRSPLPFPCVPDRPYKILLVQVGTLSFSHPSFGVSAVFIYLLGAEGLLASQNGVFRGAALGSERVRAALGSDGEFALR